MTEKLCPLKQYKGDMTYECVKECAWWNEGNKACAVTSIAYTLGAMWRAKQ